MATTKTTSTKDGGVYANVPIVLGEEVFQDEMVAMETGTRGTKQTSKAPRRRQPIDVSTTTVVRSAEQESNDFWTCCVAQGICGILGSGVVYCINSNRPNYPTPQAWEGCCTGFLVVFILYLVLAVLGSY